MLTIIIPDLISTLIILLTLVGMYHGIEIGHPVFSVLFTNLVSALVSSGPNVIKLFQALIYKCLQ